MALSFLFGAGTNDTPETLKQKRALANALISAQGAPKNVGEGLNALGDGIVAAVLNNRADATQKAGQDSANSAFSGLAAALSGSPSSTGPQASAGIPSPGAQSEIGASAPGISASPDATDLNGYLNDPGRRATLPAGMRNNNPGNIKFVGQKIPGIVGPSTNTDQGDPQAVFDTPESGMRAMYSLLGKKYAGGKTTPNAIIAGDMGWTPGNYQAAANVARYAGIGPNDDIGFNDPQKAARFMRGLMMQEHGKSSSLYPDSMIAAAIGGQPTQVASNDPSVGMQAAAQPQAYVDPRVTTANVQPIASPAQTTTQQVAQSLVTPQSGGANMQTLLGVANNPWLTDTQKSIVGALINQNLQRQNDAYEAQIKQADPLYQLNLRRGQTELDNTQSPDQQEAAWRARQDYVHQMQLSDPLRQAQTQEALAKAKKAQDPRADETFYGNPIAIQTPSGIQYGQIGNQGTFKPIDIGQGNSFAPNVKTVDTGTEIVVTGPGGAELARIPKQNFQEAQQKALGTAVGKGTGEAQLSVPQIEGAANQMLSSIDSLANDPYLGHMVGPVAGRWLPNVSGDSQRVQAKMDQIGGQSFLQAYNTLRGGGQITEIEGQKATQAMARLNTAQNEADYRSALNDLRSVVSGAVERARQKAGMPVQAPAQMAPATQGNAGSDVPAGVSPDIWSVMTPEEKALWQKN